MFKMKKTSFMVRCALQAPAMVLLLVSASPAHAVLPVAQPGAAWNPHNPNVRMTMPSANHLRIDQTDNATHNWILNWQSFNISQGSRVQFVQPNADHIALNRILGSNRSEILGQLDANGRVYLINPHGFLFGSTSTINVNSLVASSLALNIADEAFVNNSINLLNVIDNGGAAFINGLGAGAIAIESGARITTADGGNVLIIAPEIISAGDIDTRSGQVILAAAQDRVYLTPSYDSSLRGFLVELGGDGGKVTVEEAGRILAERGNITLAGLAINQNGVLQATSSIYENGSIRLLARDQANTAMLANDLDNNADLQLVLGVKKTSGRTYHVATNTENADASSTIGDGVMLGSRSRIEITPDANDTAQVVDEQQVHLSRVEITGHDITLQSGAQIVATGGEVVLHATSNPQTTALNNDILRDDRANNTSLIVMETGSRIDVSGTTDTEVAMARNQLEIQLTGDFLRDAPLQRNGVLRNERVNVDIREGTPLGDISAEVAANIKRDIGERLSVGGDVQLLSQGGVVMQQGSEVNIAGGAVHYNEGYINTSRLVTTQGRVVDIAEASRDYSYGGTFGSLAIESERWGSAGERSWSMFGGSSGGGVSRFHEAYTEGRDAGNFTIHAPAIAGMANIIAGTDVSPLARTTEARASGGDLNIITTGQQINVVRDATAPVLADMQAWLQHGGNSLPDFDLQLDERVFSSGLSNIVITEDRTNSAEFFGGSFTVESAANIQMASGGSLSVDSGSIDVQGGITIQGGDVALTSSTLTTVANHIDVSGTWVNDTPESGGELTQAVDMNAGAISIQAMNIDLTQNSELLANGGGWLQADGNLQTGQGGKISLAVRDPNGGSSELLINGSMQAFGVNESRGGSLSITANRMHIAPEPAAHEAGLLQFTPEFFTRNGFADYTLTSNKGELIVATGSDITPRASNLLLRADAAFHQTGEDVRTFADEMTLPQYLRAATNLGLNANQSAINGGIPTATSSLTIEHGASISTDPGARVTLSSASRLLMQGDITAHGGDINLSLRGYSQQTGVVADQVLWMDGMLDVSGVFVAAPMDDTGLRQGRMLDGGTISLTATDGFIIATENSAMDVSAVSDTMDLPASAVGNTVLAWSRQPVQGDAGNINVQAAEGFILAGDMNADTASSSASGGSLSLVLDAYNRINTEPGSYTTSQGARQIHLVQTDSELANVPTVGDSLPLAGVNNMIGQGWVAADNITEAGFDSLAMTTVNHSATAAGNGIINLHDDVSLSLRQVLQLNAPVIRGNGEASLDAAYVFLGSVDKTNRLYGDVAASGGSGVLNIHADGLLEIGGHVRTLGFDAVALRSEGDVRARGIDNRTGLDAFRLDGSLHAGGDLTLQAAQIYASTLSEFEFTANNSLNIQAGGEHTAVLSAGSVLEFNANTINHGGVIKAPMGEIHFNANELNIQAGSLTSVSAENQVIPFGQIRGEQLWYYGEDLASPQNLPNTQESAPDKSIVLNADVIAMDENAAFDISGGGDLYAWEHVPGLGGSNDNLLTEYNNGAFAVLPGFSGYAPHDEIWWQDVSGINPGDQIYLGGSSELAAGVYTILPARYALLPGAVLVTPASSSLLPGQTYQQLNGSVVVAGQQRIANTAVQDEQWSGYVIDSSDVVRSRSEYFEATASQFFRDAATRNDTSPGVMPEDAGALDIIAGSELNLAGVLRGNAATVNYTDENGEARTASGRGSQVNIAGDTLRVVNAYDAHGGIQLLDEALNDFGAASMLLGGARQRSAEGTRVDVSADSVSIENGAALNIPDLILAATHSVNVNTGAVINASGNAGKQDEKLILNGDGALLRASSAGQASMVRNHESVTPVQGTLTVASGAQISADASMILDASASTTVAGDLMMDGGSLNLGARRISLGDVSGNPDGLVLDSTDLARLDVNELVLSSRSSVDLYGDLDLTFSHLQIEAAAVNGFQQSGENAVLRADSISLGNVGNASSSLTADGHGNLMIAADEIALSEGAIALRGFNDINLQSATKISIAGDGALNTDATGILTLDGRITASQRRAEYSIATNGQLLTLNSAASTAPRSEAVAASLELNANQIVHSGEIDLASGEVVLRASQADVELANGSVINVSGISRDFAGDMRYSAGGHVELVSNHGDITQSSGAEINVSGGGHQGAAGGVKAVATGGAVNLAGDLLAVHGENESGGGFVADANSINNFTALNQQLNANGFDQQRHMRVRQGDITLATDESIQAQDVMLAADAGNITVNGTIDASGEKAGEVVLAARDNVTLSNGAHIDASASGNDERGGRVFIETRQGMIDLAAGASIDVSGMERGGRIHLRAPRTVTNNGINIISAAATMNGFERVDVEGFRSYNPGNTLDAGDFTAPYLDAAAFMANDVLGALDFSVALDDVHLRPGVEFNTTGDLAIGADMDFIVQRYDNNHHSEAGVLTVRATGHVNVNGTLSDGMLAEASLINPDIQFDVLATGESWSYRLIAGADLNSAAIMSTQGSSADLTLASNRKLRTGTGSIQLATADDLIMNSGAAIYSAGENTGRGTLAADSGEFVPDWAGFGPLMDLMYLPGVQFPQHGGDVSVVAGDVIDGNAVSYLSTDWLQRVAIDVSASNNDSLVMWGVDFRQLTQGVSALGGGNVNVRAGGDVRELALYAPQTGRQIGDIQAQFDDSNFVFDFGGSENNVELLGGGNVSLQLGGDLTSSVVHADRGEIHIDAGGDIGHAGNNSGIYLLMANTTAQLNARGDIYFEGAGNVTMQELSLKQELSMDALSIDLGSPALPLNYFSTVSASSALSLSSLGGNVSIRDSINTSMPGEVVSITSGLKGEALYYPASMSVLALDGDVVLSSFDLYPSSRGQLSILAQNNITTAAASTVSVKMSSQIPVELASWQNPMLSGSDFPEPDLDNLLHQDDTTPVRIVARQGDIAPMNETQALIFDLPKAAQLYAGRDMVAINLYAVHMHDDDISFMQAGRDFRHINTVQYNTGAVQNRVEVNGPGELQIIAGRNIELGNSAGIQSKGDTSNAELPDAGADILVLAGADHADFQGFINQYFVSGSEYEQDVIAYMNARGFSFGDDQFADALAAFNSLTGQEQRSLVVNSYFNEISQSAQRAAQEQNNLLAEDDFDRFGYSRGLDAVAALFPSSVMEKRQAADGEKTAGNIIVTGGFAYVLNEHGLNGDISMISSNIRVNDDDSRLNVLVPGGLLNVGLSVRNENDNNANPNGLLASGNGDINIYALGDIAVNQSRIQALNGGDMVIWSTLGDIDAGKGAKSQFSLPGATMLPDYETGRLYLEYQAEPQGSGIRGACFDTGCEAGDIVLAAPGGAIDAGDAGIEGDRIVIAAPEIRNGDNIQGGETVGFSTETTAMGLDVGNLGNAAGDSTTTVAGEDAADAFSNAAVAILQVEVMGLSDEEGNVSATE